MISTGCGSTISERRLDAAAQQIGKQEAGILMPPLPDYCRTPMPKVLPKLDEPVWGTQKRWEVVHDQENKRVAWCAAHYDEMSVEMAGGKRGNDGAR